MFYDDIAVYYDLIYADWEGSMQRHGAAISEIVGVDPESARILDVAAGIGTQALALASLGYSVVARDLSTAAISRLAREAEARGLCIDSAQCDMRNVRASVSGTFDAVIAFDNSIPHLQSDDEILEAFRGFAALLRPGGVVLISVRDYEQVDRATSHVPHGERSRGEAQYRMSQHWTWLSPTHYRTTMIVEERRGDGWTELVRSDAPYYAVSTGRLLALMQQAGLDARRVDEVAFFQPVLCGRAG